MQLDLILPHNCALLLGVPLDRESFERASIRGSGFLSANGMDRYARYEPLARSVRELSADCGALGCAVFPAATLEDLEREARRRKVICLLAHCEYPSLVDSDILDPDAFRDRMLHGAELECQAVRSIIGSNAGIEEIIAAANLHMGLLYSGPVRFGRPGLERLFGPEVLRPAQAIELSADTLDTAEVIESIPQSRILMLNLSLCRSIELGVAIHTARPLAHCLVDRRLSDPTMALLRFKQQLIQLASARLSGQPIGYPEAVLRSTDHAIPPSPPGAIHRFHLNG